MANILIDELPDAVEIDGVEVPINTDFRACLNVIMAFEDQELVPFERMAILMDNLYSEPVTNVTSAYKLGLQFLHGGIQEEAEGDRPAGPRLYSFRRDANLIYAAFRQTHGIDLQTAVLHWWVFLALWQDLGADTLFCNLVNFRNRVKSGEKLTDTERKAYHEMKDLIDLEEFEEPLEPEEQARLDEVIRAAREHEARREREQQEAKLRS